jgi:hypothetical protein
MGGGAASGEQGDCSTRTQSTCNAPFTHSEKMVGVRRNPRNIRSLSVEYWDLSVPLETEDRIGYQRWHKIDPRSRARKLQGASSVIML